MRSQEECLQEWVDKNDAHPPKSRQEAWEVWCELSYISLFHLPQAIIDKITKDYIYDPTPITKEDLL